MTRNTVRRVEVAAPVLDEEIKNKIRYMFDTMLSDNEKGKEQNALGQYEDREENGSYINSQEIFFQNAYDAVSKSSSKKKSR